jgi:hypothetical protein
VEVADFHEARRTPVSHHFRGRSMRRWWPGILLSLFSKTGRMVLFDETSDTISDPRKPCGDCEWSASTHIVPFIHGQQSLPQFIRLDAHLETRRVHFEAGATSASFRYIASRCGPPVETIVRPSHDLPAVVSRDSRTYYAEVVRPRAHTLVIMPLHVMTSASTFWPVLSSRSTMASRRLTRCSSSVSSRLRKFLNPALRSAPISGV